MEWIWLLLLLPVAYLAGWLSARRQRKKAKVKQEEKLSSDYFRGLNYLLSDQQDKALPIFLKLVQVDNETADTHLTLASLYRRNGEIEKAITVHQNLIARPSLPAYFRSKALLELGRDYLAAGLFDRAENLFNDVIKTGQFSREARLHMLTIYQQEREWHDAVKVANALINEGDTTLNSQIAQFYCELSDEAYRQGNRSQTVSYAELAISYKSSCIRAYLILARIAKTERKYKQAIKYLHEIEQADVEYFPAILEEFIECYRELGQVGKLITYLQEIQKEHPELSIIDTLVKLTAEVKGHDAALDFVKHSLVKKPELKGLQAMLSLQTSEDENCTNLIHDTRYIMEQISNSVSQYQCRSCGYTAGTLYWQCPSCHTWGTIKPVIGEVDKQKL